MPGRQAGEMAAAPQVHILPPLSQWSSSGPGGHSGLRHQWGNSHLRWVRGCQVQRILQYIMSCINSQIDTNCLFQPRVLVWVGCPMLGWTPMADSVQLLTAGGETGAVTSDGGGGVPGVVKRSEVKKSNRFPLCSPLQSCLWQLFPRLCMTWAPHQTWAGSTWSSLMEAGGGRGAGTSAIGGLCPGVSTRV